MTTSNLIARIRNQPETVEFDEVMQYIAEHYLYTPASFSNGIGNDRIVNEAGKNEGSCKIFALGLKQGLSKSETLACFGKYYREEVLNDPDGHSHANIRSFIKHGWQGIHFESDALNTK